MPQYVRKRFDIWYNTRRNVWVYVASYKHGQPLPPQSMSIHATGGSGGGAVLLGGGGVCPVAPRLTFATNTSPTRWSSNVRAGWKDRIVLAKSEAVAADAMSLPQASASLGIEI